MEPLIVKRYSMRQHPHFKLLGQPIGLVDADSQTRSFYQQKLEQANILVTAAADLAQLAEETGLAELRAVIYSPNVDKLDREMLILGQFISANPKLPVITISRTMQEMQLDAIMKLGTRMHINRDLSHPRDLLIVLEQIL